MREKTSANYLLLLDQILVDTIPFKLGFYSISTSLREIKLILFLLTLSNQALSERRMTYMCLP